MIVFLYGNFRTDIFLGNSECLFDGKLNRQAMGIPTGLAFYLLAFQCLVSAKDVLDGTRHHVVNARHAIGTRRSFIKHKGVFLAAFFDAATEDVI